MKCHKCAKQMNYSKKLRFNGELIPGYACTCGEEYFDAIDLQPVLLKNKLRKEQLTAKLGRVRSNLILRLPKDIETALHLSEKDEVLLQLEGDSLKVTKSL